MRAFHWRGTGGSKLACQKPAANGTCPRCHYITNPNIALLRGNPFICIVWSPPKELVFQWSLFPVVVCFDRGKKHPYGLDVFIFSVGFLLPLYMAFFGTPKRKTHTQELVTRYVLVEGFQKGTVKNHQQRAVLVEMYLAERCFFTP